MEKEENFYTKFPFFNKRKYTHNPILYTLIDIFMHFIANVTLANLKRLQDWLHALANLLPVIHQAYHQDELMHDGTPGGWTPTEEQQACMTEWYKANEGIHIRTLRGISFSRIFSLGVEFPQERSSTYVSFDNWNYDYSRPSYGVLRGHRNS